MVDGHCAGFYNSDTPKTLDMIIQTEPNKYIPPPCREEGCDTVEINDCSEGIVFNNGFYSKLFSNSVLLLLASSSGSNGCQKQTPTVLLPPDSRRFPCLRRREPGLRNCFYILGGFLRYCRSGSPLRRTRAPVSMLAVGTIPKPGYFGLSNWVGCAAE